MKSSVTCCYFLLLPLIFFQRIKDGSIIDSVKTICLVYHIEAINEENIVGAIKFYNDTVVEFNRVVVSFPSKIVAIFRRYHKKEFYNNEKREIFEILNNK